jgi:hypothetical protein
MKPHRFRRHVLIATIALPLGAAQFLLPQGWATRASAQGGKAGVEKLYILNCGEGVAGDISRWSPGVNEGKSMDFVDNCYLIKHSQGWFQTTASMQRMADVMAKEKAQLWINHDKAQRDGLKMSPEFYE